MRVPEFDAPVGVIPRSFRIQAEIRTEPPIKAFGGDGFFEAFLVRLASFQTSCLDRGLCRLDLFRLLFEFAPVSFVSNFGFRALHLLSLRLLKELPEEPSRDPS